MPRSLPVVFLCLSSALAMAQSGSDGSADYASFTTTVKQLLHASSNSELDAFWQSMANAGSIPLVVGDSVAFLYRGDASSVSWYGDFNEWGYYKGFDANGKRANGTDLWVLRAKFPHDARLDYKIVVNGTNRILDPVNPHQQWSGLGGGSPNSELRMPGWKPDPMTLTIDSVKGGTVKRDILLTSKVLGYQITYSVYLPHTFDMAKKYPVVYVTDGYEYMHDKMGNMITVLDNMIFLGRMAPVIAVFVDQREPANRANNRKMQELTMNATYLDFYMNELVPVVEQTYPVSSDSKDHAILGNGMGGLTAAYFAFSDKGTFGMAGIQSPSFWLKPDIYKYCDSPTNPPVKIYMTTGEIHDSEEAAQRMKQILDKNTCTYQYSETPQGGSWGNWRDTIDDILAYFFPPNS